MDSRPAEHRFHLTMAGALLLLAIAGFGRSYWLKLADGSFGGAPIYHVHGLLMTAWFGLYAVQAWFVARGRIQRHRDWGLAGIALFSVMICGMIALTMRSMQRDLERAGGDIAALQFPTVTLVSIVLAAGLFAAAVANIHRPAVHKRLMLIVMVVLVQAAVARLAVLPFFQGPPSLAVTVPTALVSDVLILVAMLHDWRVNGRVHGAYFAGGLVTLATQLLAVPFAASAAGTATALAVGRLMG